MFQRAEERAGEGAEQQEEERQAEKPFSSYESITG
jgi:hypothetical protein